MPLKPSLPYARFAPKGIPLPLDACRPWQFVEGRDGNGFVYVFETESWEVYDPKQHETTERNPFGVLPRAATGRRVLEILFADLPRPWYFLGRREFVEERLVPRVRRLELGLDDDLEGAAETEIARVYGPEPRAEAEAGAWEDALRELAQDAAEAAGLV